MSTTTETFPSSALAAGDLVVEVVGADIRLWQATSVTKVTCIATVQKLKGLPRALWVNHYATAEFKASVEKNVLETPELTVTKLYNDKAAGAELLRARLPFFSKATVHFCYSGSGPSGAHGFTTKGHASVPPKG